MWDKRQLGSSSHNFERRASLIGIDRELRKLLDQPDYRITLCVDCHSTTFFSSALPHLLTPDEKDELRDINKRTRELSERRKELKKKYENQWNTVSYQSQKHIIDKTFEELNRRRKEIRENGRIRLNNRRQEVIRLCDDQLLRVVDPNLFED